MKIPPGIRVHHGSYQVRYWGNGKLQQKSFRRLSDARRYQREVAVDKDRGQWLDPRTGRVLFGTWAESYLAQKLALRPRTLDKYNSALRNHLEPAFGTTPVGAVTRNQVQEWIAQQVRDGFAPESVRGHYALLAAIFKRAASDGVIPRTPCRDIELPRVVRQEQRYLDESAVEVLAAAHSPRYRAVVFTATYLGLRSWLNVH